MYPRLFHGTIYYIVILEKNAGVIIINIIGQQHWRLALYLTNKAFLHIPASASVQIYKIAGSLVMTSIEICELVLQGYSTDD